MNIELNSDQYYMEQAIKQANKAYSIGEVPVGAVIVKDFKIIAKSFNQVEMLKDATAHAEMLSLTQAQDKVGDRRLIDCDLYVTKEPCPMCAGAIVNCRIKRVIFGCSDYKGGACGGLINLLNNSSLNHSSIVVSGIMEEESKNLLKTFFMGARIKNNNTKNKL